MASSAGRRWAATSAVKSLIVEAGSCGVRGSLAVEDGAGVGVDEDPRRRAPGTCGTGRARADAVVVGLLGARRARPSPRAAR